MRVVCLAGGVGGAKLADGLQQVLSPGELTVVVNTGDDFEWNGLLVCPDHDTVMYSLAGIADPVQGWGIQNESWRVFEQYGSLGGETWFRVGDQDLATHVYRTGRLSHGARLTETALELQLALGVRSRILPMSDDPVRTQVLAVVGGDERNGENAQELRWLDFQEYFVRLRQQPAVRQVRFAGVDAAAPTPDVLEAIDDAEAIVVAPSNPIVSIGPILAVPGLGDAIRSAGSRAAVVVGVSGIVGGRALKGPADRMLASLGEESSALGVARRYEGIVEAFVIDEEDRALAPAIEALGMSAVVTGTIMTDRASRARLAAEVLEATGVPS
jgi:LPPG:FO 2-phospho-L-lactate transferase